MSDPIVLLHAFSLDARMWDGVRPALPGRVLALDLPGFGSAPPAPGPSLDDAASAVLATLDREGVSRAVFCGCSMGGYVAMAVLRAAPSRVAGLALVNTRASADTPEVRRDRLAVAARVESDGVGWVPDEMGRVWLGRTTLAERPAVVARLRELIIAQRPEALAWGVRAMAARPPSFDVLRAAEVPALVVAGAEDALIPGEEATAMADALRGASLVEVDGAGHLLPLEAPTRLAEVLTGWLGSTRLA